MGLRSWKFWLGIVISVVFLYLFIRDIKWHELWTTILAVQIFFLIAMFLVNVSSFLIRALRWRYFFQGEKIPGFHALFSATAIGFLANALLPLRIGEIVRAVILGQKENIPKSTCLGTLVIERLFDMLSILFFFALYIIFFAQPSLSDSGHHDYMHEITIAGYTSGLMCLVVIIGLVALRFRTAQTLRLIDWTISWLPDRFHNSIMSIIKSFINGLDIMKDLKAFCISVVLSLVLWVWIIFQTYLLLLAFNLDLGFTQAIFLLVVMAFSVMVPAAPGYVGTFHYGTMIALAIMGVNETVASGVAIIGHVFSMFPIALVGFVYLWLENMSLLDLQKQQLKTEQVSLTDENSVK
ncbi:flippase-like domain-containing protein [bacterium]|nr:flippase-like domain-containing protein [bacterium]